MLRRILDRPVTVTMALLVVMVLGIVSMRTVSYTHLTLPTTSRV